MQPIATLRYIQSYTIGGPHWAHRKVYDISYDADDPAKVLVCVEISTPGASYMGIPVSGMTAWIPALKADIIYPDRN